ncbi:glycosyltransferase [Kaistella sp. 97-N-M2]|uniref:glycosyltransferase n=1 Tax=Kaistella sp. 97-N-M2 TaxID=2908645 RepID=UPI001F3C6414|nr:glycosyltransferase family 2 protein [Kaistella sp. 97-N-M2]UJF28767.1 glycosyltransferase [Kaistella sp. 97-N-M2]
MKLLAVVIPYYKRTFFRECLASLAAQTDQRFTVYIGNDASSENPEDLLKEFEGKFNFVYKKFEENFGRTSLTKHWDRCIEMMEDEEWFMILGDDDCLGQNAIESFYESFHEINESHNVVRFSTQIINDCGTKISKVYQQPESENALRSYQRKLLGQNRSSLSEYIFRILKYKKYGLKNYPLAWSVDDRAVIDFCENKDIFSINRAVVYVRMSASNISSTMAYSNLMQEAILESSRELIFDYKKKMDRAQLRFFIENYENCALIFTKVDRRDLINITKLFLLYMPIKSKIYILKVILSKAFTKV